MYLSFAWSGTQKLIKHLIYYSSSKGDLGCNCCWSWGKNKNPGFIRETDGQDTQLWQNLGKKSLLFINYVSFPSFCEHQKLFLISWRGSKRKRNYLWNTDRMLLYGIETQTAQFLNINYLINYPVYSRELFLALIIDEKPPDVPNVCSISSKRWTQTKWFMLNKWIYVLNFRFVYDFDFAIEYFIKLLVELWKDISVIHPSIHSLLIPFLQ